MRIGFDIYTIAHRAYSPAEALDFAKEHGFAGIQFLEPSALDRDLNHDRLVGIANHARELGHYLEIGLPSPNPTRRARSEERPINSLEHAEYLIPHILAVSAMGCKHARVYVGDRHDRFRREPSWQFQLEETQKVLSALVPTLRECGLKVAIETHADVTLHEMLELLNALPDDVAGVTLDTGNLVMRLDDPVEVVETLAPKVICTHVKDAVLARTPRGLCWQARPVGSGILPMPDLLAPLLRANPNLNFSVELHPRTYDLPILDPTWLAHFPHNNLPAVLELAAKAELKYANGTLATPEFVEAIPWPERDFEGLAQSLGYLKKLLPILEKMTERLDSPSGLSDVK